jgi:alpha-beta hydrolase superfamily lysophospholipase
MADLREFTFPSSDGIHQIHGAEWLPWGEPPCAVIQITHGLSEYILRYDEFARFLTARGFAVVGHDHLGHGKTAKGPEEYGFLGEQNGWDHLTQDVRALRELTGARYPGLPYFLLGHSMGSFAARTYLIRWPGTLSGCILSGTGQPAPALVACGKSLANVLSRVKGANTVSKVLTGLSMGAYNKKFRPNRTAADWISRDIAVVDAYVADPLCRFVPTVGLYRDMMEGLQFISDTANLSKMDPQIPVFFFSGDQDPVGDMGAGVRRVFESFRAAGVKDLSFKLYPDGRHEMLNELCRDGVYRDVLDWLERHI